jgi:hypothetical protein
MSNSFYIGAAVAGCAGIPLIYPLEEGHFQLESGHQARDHRE